MLLKILSICLKFYFSCLKIQETLIVCSKSSHHIIICTSYLYSEHILWKCKQSVRVVFLRFNYAVGNSISLILNSNLNVCVHLWTCNSIWHVFRFDLKITCKYLCIFFIFQIQSQYNFHVFSLYVCTYYLLTFFVIFRIP